MIVLGLYIPNLESGSNDYRIRNDIKYRRIIICIVVLLIVFCAFKKVSAPSIDEYAYRRRFDSYNGLSLKQALDSCEGEYINGLLTWISTILFKTNQGIFIVFDSLSAFFYMYSIKKYSGNYAFAVALLMFMGIINTSFNITQQCVGCAVFVCFSNFIYERKTLKFLLLVLACIFIHGSAIILLPLYFCGNRVEERTKLKPYIMFAGLILAFLYSKISYVASQLPMLEQYVSRVEGANGISTNIITILINCIPAILVLAYRKFLKENDKVTMLAGNMCFVHAAIYLVAIYDNYIARLALYTAPFCVIFLSRCLNMFEDKSKKIFMMLTIVLYAIELYIRIKGYTYTFNFAF